MAEFYDASGKHLLGETKVYNPVVSSPTELRRAAVYAFGATEHDLRVEILGERAGSAAAPLEPRPDGVPRKAKYQHALDGGHRVVPLIHEVFGGLASEADAFMRELARLRKNALGADSVHASWSARSFAPFWRQRLSLALHSGCALELARVIAKGEEDIRAAERRWGRAH